jgi:RimJ/RimL family protein N-acetyltransferase
MTALQTARLLLRPHRVSDLDAYLRIWTEADASPFSFSLDAENTWYRLLRWIGHWTHFGYGPFVLEDKASGALVGEAGFAHFHRGRGERFDSAPEAGWRLIQSRRGEGLAREAMQAACELFESTSRERRAVCMIDPGNHASLRLATRLGFVEYARDTYKQLPVLLLERTW